MEITNFAETLRRLDIVFVIDTTGSMESCIRQVQEKLNNFAQAITASSIQPDIAFGVVAYRDHPPEEMTYVTQVYPVSSNLGAVQEIINKLRADGGGDEPEAVMDGLWDALRQSRWRPNAHKVIVLVGDAPAHETCPSGLTFEMIIQQAKAQQIPIFTVGTSRQAQMIKQFRQLADSTNGLFIQLDDIRLLIEKILSMLQQTVIVDMEVSMAIYNRRMKGLSPAEIAQQIGRSESEVISMVHLLEKKGAQWPPINKGTSIPAAFKEERLTKPSTSPIINRIAIATPTHGTDSLPGKPVIVPINNLQAKGTYQVRWMGWQGTGGYELQESVSENFADVKTVYVGRDTSWMVTGQPKGLYFYRIRLTDGKGRYGEWSELQRTNVA